MRDDTRRPPACPARAHSNRLKLAAACALLAAASAQASDSWPTRPIRILVTSPPGGANDTQARVLSAKLGERLGQAIVIDNRPGASGMIAAEIVAKSPPDGHTLLMGTNSTFVVNPYLFPAVPYDTLRDFAPVSITVTTPHVLLVHPSLPAGTVKELVALAKSRPGRLNYASSGSGSAFHLGMELLKTAGGMDIVHVPYKGSALSVQALLAGDVQVMLVGMQNGLPLAKSGRARLLGVANPARSPLAPDLPTIAEAGVPGFGYQSWFGVVAPAATPKAIIARLHEALTQPLQQADTRDRLAALGYEVIGTNPAGMATKIREDGKIWSKVIKDSGAKPE
jgi:tripartite-type tricarboxylate transporter receptor subunit TctC